jgi:hypothetical protein
MDAAEESYVRARDLPKLLPLWPCEIRADAADASLARLRKAPGRAAAQPATVDVRSARRAQLLRTYRAEVCAHLRAKSQSVESSRRKRA